MARLAWATDIHVNFVSARALEQLCAEMVASDPDALLITGDIAEAPTLRGALQRIADLVRRPVYFVLGNHDYYFGSIERVRESTSALCSQSPWLRYLNDVDYIELSPATALVGHDGWGDARYGAYWLSTVRMSDFEVITDFIGLDRGARWRRLNELGDEAGRHFQRVLDVVVPRYENVIVATHVPPIDRAAWHEGAMSNPTWLPFFSCKAAGDAIRAAFAARPECRGTVYCGHTHGSGEIEALPNVRVVTGGAVYSKPILQGLLEVA